jgi:hypothetical protein
MRFNVAPTAQGLLSTERQEAVQTVQAEKKAA